MRIDGSIDELAVLHLLVQMYFDLAQSNHYSVNADIDYDAIKRLEGEIEAANARAVR